MFDSVERLKVRIQAGRLIKLPLKKLMLVIPIEFTESPTVPTLRLHQDRMTINISERTEEEIAYIIAHGTLYFQLRHHKRGRDICPKDLWPVWVLASEITRTDMFDLYGTQVRNNTIFLRPRDLALPPGKSVEDYYHMLLEGAKTPQARSSADYGDDNFSGKECDLFGDGAEAESGEVQGRAGGASDAQAGEVDEASVTGGDMATAEGEMADESDDSINLDSVINSTQKSILDALGRGLLSSHGELQYFREENRDLALIQKLRRLIMSECHSVSNSLQIKRFSSPRPRRRSLDPRIILMDTVKLGQRIAVLVDVSGSTSFYRQEVFDTLAAVIRASRLVDIYIGDTEILEKHMRIKRPDQLKGLPDGGGTSMDVLIKSLDEKGYKAVFVVTDGITPWPEETKARVYACLIGELREEMVKEVPKWIRIV